jgi:hypothetical protein
LLKLAFEPGTALDQGELRLTQPVAAASIGNMADNEIVESAGPSLRPLVTAERGRLCFGRVRWLWPAPK